MQLLPHSSQARGPVLSFELEAERRADGALALRYRLEADLARLQLPSATDPVRTDGLWRHTSFEAFVGAPESEAYCELNFSPSGEWAAYAFTGYRAGRSLPELPNPPAARWRQSRGRLELAVVLSPPALVREAGPLRLAASAVLEEQSGTISYWALRHPELKPDFHHPGSFVWQFP
jgi:hypothetical protein